MKSGSSRELDASGPVDAVFEDLTASWRPTERMIILKTPDEIAMMAQASRVVAEALEVLKRAVRAGVTTDELDRLQKTKFDPEARSRRSKGTGIIRRRYARR